MVLSVQGLPTVVLSVQGLLTVVLSVQGLPTVVLSVEDFPPQVRFVESPPRFETRVLKGSLNTLFFSPLDFLAESAVYTLDIFSRISNLNFTFLSE